LELFSDYFKQAVLQAINSGKMVLGTVMLNPNPFTDAIKQMPQVKLLTVNRENRQQVLEEVLAWLKAANLLKEGNR